MIKLSPMEEECKCVLETVQDNLAIGRATTRVKYEDMMGRIRQALIHLTNREYGCATGLHAGPCECKK